MERLHSQIALAAFLQELGEAVEEAELVRLFLIEPLDYCQWSPFLLIYIGGHDDTAVSYASDIW